MRSLWRYCTTLFCNTIRQNIEKFTLTRSLWFKKLFQSFWNCESLHCQYLTFADKRLALNSQVFEKYSVQIICSILAPYNALTVHLSFYLSVLSVYLFDNNLPSSLIHHCSLTCGTITHWSHYHLSSAYSRRNAERLPTSKTPKRRLVDIYA